MGFSIITAAVILTWKFNPLFKFFGGHSTSDSPLAFNTFVKESYSSIVDIASPVQHEHSHDDAQLYLAHFHDVDEDQMRLSIWSLRLHQPTTVMNNVNATILPILDWQSLSPVALGDGDALEDIYGLYTLLTECSAGMFVDEIIPPSIKLNNTNLHESCVTANVLTRTAIRRAGDKVQALQQSSGGNMKCWNPVPILFSRTESKWSADQTNIFARSQELLVDFVNTAGAEYTHANGICVPRLFTTISMQKLIKDEATFSFLDFIGRQFSTDRLN
eukprot:Lankesteria_metandrocarpae@DN7335_c0_g1_i1.p1